MVVDLGDVLGIEAHTPAVGGDEAGDQAQERGLAAAAKMRSDGRKKTSPSCTASEIYRSVEHLLIAHRSSC